MQNYEFDQSGLGEFLESDRRADQPKESRIEEVRHALTKALRNEVIVGCVTVVLCLVLRSSLIYLPMWFSIIWSYMWFVTLIRTCFGVTGLWKMGIVKEERIAFAKSLWKQMIVQAAIMVWMCLLDGIYMNGEKQFVVYFLIMGFVFAIVAYGLCYMSCNIKRLRWWEFSNYEEEYWKY